MKKIILLAILTNLFISGSAYAINLGREYDSNTTSVKLRPTKYGDYIVDVSMGIKNCGGSFSGLGQLNTYNNIFTVYDSETHLKEYPNDDADNFIMEFKVSKNGNRMTIVKEPGSYYHGAACSFTDGGNPKLKKIR